MFWRTRSHKPLLLLDIFHSRCLTLAVIWSICMFTAQGLALVALSFLLQHTYRFGVLQAVLCRGTARRNTKSIRSPSAENGKGHSLAP